MKKMIINRPQWQTGKQRVLFGSMTFFFWAIWVYLWLPVIGFVGWLLGINFFYTQMIELRGYLGLLHLLMIYGLIILLLGTTLLVWAYYNYFRFRGVERRTAQRPVEVSEVAERYGVAEETLTGWTQSRRLVVRHSEAGAFLGMDI